MPSQKQLAEDAYGYLHVIPSFVRELTSSLSNHGASKVHPVTQARVVNYSVLSVPWRTVNVLDILGKAGHRDLSNKSVLDLGCGYGAMATYLAMEAGARRVFALDIRRDHLDVLHRVLQWCTSNQIGTLSVVPIRGDMHTLALPAGSIDVAVIYEALSVRRPPLVAIFREVYRVLSPGGVLVLKEPNLLFPLLLATRLVPSGFLFRNIARGILGKQSIVVRGWGGQHFVSSLGMRSLLKQAGFREVEIYNTGTLEAKGLLRYLLPSYFVTGIK